MIMRHQEMPVQKRNKIFISYSRKDHLWLEKLNVHLRPLFPDKDVTPWSDQEVEAGDRWHEVTLQAIDESCIAVLMVSPDFLASEYVMKIEIPRLIEAEHAGTVKILWVPVRSSAVQDTAIGEYQAVSDPKYPLASLDEAVQDEVLVTIARAVKHYAYPKETHESHPEELTEPLRRFDLRMDSVTAAATDPHGRIWMSNGQQLKIVPVNTQEELAWRILPARRWKHYLPRIWRGGFILSDWDGNAFCISNRSATDDVQLHRARNDDLPIHLMETAADGRLVTAAWNGRIRTWTPEAAAPATFVVPRLPRYLMPLPDGELVVIDEANVIGLYDATGREKWHWNAEENIEALWPCSEARGNAALVVQLGKWRIGRIIVGQSTWEEKRFREPIICGAQCYGQYGSQYLVLAREGGYIDWLSMYPFDLIHGGSIRDTGRIKRLIGTSSTAPVVDDPVGFGITEDERVFLVRPTQLTVFRGPENASRLMLDASGQFLFLFSNNDVHLYRNPANQHIAFNVEVIGSSGTLEVNSFRKLVVNLRNKGPLPIHRLKGELHSAGIIDISHCEKLLQEPVLAGGMFSLEFSVRATAVGELPLMLSLRPGDMAGPSNLSIELKLNVASITEKNSHAIAT
jgi:hypothetical protein